MAFRTGEHRFVLDPRDPLGTGLRAAVSAPAFLDAAEIARRLSPRARRRRPGARRCGAASTPTPIRRGPCRGRRQGRLLLMPSSAAGPGRQAGQRRPRQPGARPAEGPGGVRAVRRRSRWRPRRLCSTGSRSRRCDVGGLRAGRSASGGAGREPAARVRHRTPGLGARRGDAGGAAGRARDVVARDARASSASCAAASRRAWPRAPRGAGGERGPAGRPDLLLHHGSPAALRRRARPAATVVAVGSHEPDARGRRAARGAGDGGGRGAHGGAERGRRRDRPDPGGHAPRSPILPDLDSLVRGRDASPGARACSRARAWRGRTWWWRPRLGRGPGQAGGRVCPSAFLGP